MTTRTARLDLRVSAAELERYRSLADGVGLPLAAWVRLRLAGGTVGFGEIVAAAVNELSAAPVAPKRKRPKPGKPKSACLRCVATGCAARCACRCHR